MPKLIQNITGNLIEDIEGNVGYYNFITTEFGYDDWFKIGTLEVFLQNFKYVTESTDLNKNRDIGLAYNKGKEFKELYISY